MNFKQLFILTTYVVSTTYCSNAERDILTDEIVLDETKSLEIINSNEYQLFISKRNEFVNLIQLRIENGCGLSTLKQVTNQAVESGRDKEFFELVFGDENTGKKYVDELKSAHSRLFNKYPLLHEVTLENNTTLTSEIINGFYDNVSVINQNFMNDLGPTYSGRKTDNTPCGSYSNQVKLLVCAGLCGASTGGAGAVLCGWACWCAFCNQNSEVANAIC